MGVTPWIVSHSLLGGNPIPSKILEILDTVISDKSILTDPPMFLGQFFLDNKIYLANHQKVCGLVKSENHFKLNPYKRKLSSAINGDKLVQIINDRGVDYVLDNFMHLKNLKKLGV